MASKTETIADRRMAVVVKEKEEERIKKVKGRFFREYQSHCYRQN